MKLNELLEVIDYSFDYADDEFDCTFYADAVDNKYTRLIDVKRVDTNYVVCSFTKFIEENKELVFEYIDNDAIDKKFATKLKKGLEDGKEWAFSEFFDGGWATSMLEEEKLEMLDFEK